MPRRPSLRKSNIEAALSAMTEHGLKPCAMDVSPNGAVRWHFTEPRVSLDDDLDLELAKFEGVHGQD